VHLDQWDVKPGESFTAYMEDSVSTCDFVIIVCTPEYARKSNLRSSGVGYEQQIVSGYLVNGAPRSKFIPILKSGTIQPGPECAIPRHFFGTYAIDCRSATAEENALNDLILALYSDTRYRKPPLGTSKSESHARFPRLGTHESQSIVAGSQLGPSEAGGAERRSPSTQSRTSIGMTSWLDQRIGELTKVLGQAEHRDRLDDARKQLQSVKDTVFHGLRDLGFNQEANEFCQITALPSISGRQPRVLNEAGRCRQYLDELRKHLPFSWDPARGSE
jgi:TIR domain